MAGYLESVVYARSPVWLQNLGIGLYGLAWKRRRFGADFRTQVPEFLARERFTPSEWQAYQTAQLRQMLQWCFEMTPHYRRTWSEMGLNTEDLQRFELSDLPRLPFTEKDDLRRHPDAFIANGGRRAKLHTYSTSGSTGKPLDIKMSAATHQVWSAAYEARCRRWAGVDRSMSRAMIGGRLVVLQAVSEPPFWRYNRAERQLYLSAFHIAPWTVRDYVATLNSYRPDYLVGYASAHFFLARLIAEAGVSVFSPKAVLTSSEKLTDEMRETISNVYRCDVFDAYSGVEPCCLASECERHSLHISPDVGIVEVIGDDGCDVRDGEVGEIVATGLLNRDQPLVRYRMGDLASRSAESCRCGRAMPVLQELVGRLEDTVIGGDGREMVRFHGLFIGLSHVLEGQVIQEALERFTIRVVAPTGLPASEERLIVERMRQRLGRVDVKVETVEALERTPRGKLKTVISNVPRPARPFYRSSLDCRLVTR